MRRYDVLNLNLQRDLEGAYSMPLTSDMDLHTVRRITMAKSFWKKFQDEINQAEANRACRDLFISNNDRCGQFSWPSELTSQEAMVFEEMKVVFDNLCFCGPDLLITPSEIYRRSMVGPGATQKALSFNYYSKLFDSTLTYNHDLALWHYHQAISTFSAREFIAEDARFSRRGNLKAAGSSFAYQPKTSEISRGTCTEASAQIFLQKGFGRLLEEGLIRLFNIDLRKQPTFNRRLARQGSIDGSFGTTDLHSASDLIALRMLKPFCPPVLWRWIMVLRSPSIVFPDGEKVELNIVSTMGNAFTFPLETLLFSAVVTSCYKVLGIKPEYSDGGPSNWAVFGDDIIVRKDAFEFVNHILSLLGLIVNEEKSFNSGPFRESCGGDYWLGHDVRGVYCKTLKHDSDVYSLINRITRWSSKTGIMLPKTVSALVGWVKFLPIPPSDGDDEGIKVPVAPDYLKRTKDGLVGYYAFKNTPQTLKLPTDAAQTVLYKDRKKGKIEFNPNGLISAALRGDLTHGHRSITDKNVKRPDVQRTQIGVRSDAKHYKRVMRFTPYWRTHSELSLLPATIEQWIFGCNLLEPTVSESLKLAQLRDLLKGGSHIVAVEEIRSEHIARGRDWEVVIDLYGL